MPAATLEALLERVRRLVSGAGPNRVLIGIAGAPGSGKTTLAQVLVERLEHAAGGRPYAAHVPMDGYHLADRELIRLGRADRKGAPDTFDAGGYDALLARLRESNSTVWAPAFDRDIEQPIAGAIPVDPAVRVVVSEGNYLLLDRPEWRSVRNRFDEVWFARPDEQARQQRLIARHIQFGKSPDAARAWALGTDERNAVLISEGMSRADLIIDGDVALGEFGSPALSSPIEQTTSS